MASLKKKKNLLRLFSVYSTLFLDRSWLHSCFSHCHESPLIFQTKSQCRDKNTCCCRYVLISFFSASLFLWVFWLFICFLYSVVGNKPFHCMLLLSFLHSIFISVPLSNPPLHWTSLQFTLFCQALSWQLFAKDKIAFPFPTLCLRHYI